MPVGAGSPLWPYVVSADGLSRVPSPDFVSPEGTDRGLPKPARQCHRCICANTRPTSGDDDICDCKHSAHEQDSLQNALPVEVSALPPLEPLGPVETPVDVSALPALGPLGPLDTPVEVSAEAEDVPLTPTSIGFANNNPPRAAFALKCRRKSISCSASAGRTVPAGDPPRPPQATALFPALHACVAAEPNRLACPGNPKASLFPKHAPAT